MLYGSGCIANLILTHEKFFSSNHIRIIFTNSRFFKSLLYFHKKIYIFYFISNTHWTLKTASAGVTFWFYCCSNHGLVVAVLAASKIIFLRLLEAALGRRALGRRRRQGSEAVFRLLVQREPVDCLQRLEGLARLKINTKTSSLFHLGCPYLVASVQCWCVVHTGYVVQCCCCSQLPPF